MMHDRVKHPAELLKASTGKVTAFNQRCAFTVAGVYGAAVTIWLFVAYSVMGAVMPSEITPLLYWSNSVQLVFCAVMTFVGNTLDRHNKAKADADHEALTHIATVVDAIAVKIGA
jgi:hypothetical protein